MTMSARGISHVTAFFDLTLFPTFGLPVTLPADDQAVLATATPMSVRNGTAALTRDVALLERAMGYTLGSLVLVTPAAMANPTPCSGWDLRGAAAAHERLAAHPARGDHDRVASTWSRPRARTPTTATPNGTRSAACATGPAR